MDVVPRGTDGLVSHEGVRHPVTCPRNMRFEEPRPQISVEDVSRSE